LLGSIELCLRGRDPCERRPARLMKIWLI
jgi:hypothetical protein